MGETYAFFVWSAYGLTIAVLSGLALFIALDWRRQKQLLERLEAAGTPRRGKAKRKHGGS